MPDAIVTRLLGLPGYGVYGWEVDDATNTLTLAIRPTAAEPVYVCGGCGISVREIHSWTERRLRDLPWGPWTVWLRVDVHRVRCRRCGVRTERLPFLEGKVHYTNRLEAAVAQECESAPVPRVAAQRGLPPETVRRMDKRALRRWGSGRPRPPLRYLGIDEFFVGQVEKFLTVVSDLETGEPRWVGRERKRTTLDQFFAEALPPARRRAVRAVCVDMWEPFRLSLQAHLPHAKIVYDKFHVLRHASEALDETRRAEFFRQGAEARGPHPRQALAAVAPLDPSRRRGATHAARPLRAQSPLGQGVRAQGATRAPLELHLRGRRLPLPDPLAARLAVAAAAGVPEAERAADPAPRRHLELLPREGPVREGRSDQRQHPGDAPPGPRLP